MRGRGMDETTTGAMSAGGRARRVRAGAWRGSRRSPCAGCGRGCWCGSGLGAPRCSGSGAGHFARARRASREGCGPSCPGSRFRPALRPRAQRPAASPLRGSPTIRMAQARFHLPLHTPLALSIDERSLRADHVARTCTAQHITELVRALRRRGMARGIGLDRGQCPGCLRTGRESRRCRPARCHRRRRHRPPTSTPLR